MSHDQDGDEQTKSVSSALEAERPASLKRSLNWRWLIPGLFLLLAAVLFLSLFRDPKEVPSPLIGKLTPNFQLLQLEDSNRYFSPVEMRGKVWLLNVWASWCPPCRAEHPVLMELSRLGIVPIVSLNYKDQREAALEVLRKTGNPYAISTFDPAGAVALDWGVYGAPETFLIDENGIVRAKYVGPLTAQVIEEWVTSFFLHR